MSKIIEQKKRGVKPKYLTEEEKKEAQRLNAKRYYEKHREACLKKQAEKNKLEYDIIRRYKQGEIGEINKNNPI